VDDLKFECLKFGVGVGELVVREGWLVDKIEKDEKEDCGKYK
jgi:hypothetical protein